MSMSIFGRKLSRRSFLVAGAVSVAGVAAFGVYQKPAPLGETLTPKEAHHAAVSGQVTLVDIRRPDEWAKTGSGEGAHRLDMRRKDFVAALDTLVAGRRDAPIALICAAGVRSKRTRGKLISAGFTNVIDVPEGMTGSRAGPGWVSRGLPVQK